MHMWHTDHHLVGSRRSTKVYQQLAYLDNREVGGVVIYKVEFVNLSPIERPPKSGVESSSFVRRGYSWRTIPIPPAKGLCLHAPDEYLQL